MNRRELLARVGATAVATAVTGMAGCSEDRTVECRPDQGDVRLGDVEFHEELTASFRGAVVGISEGVLVDDTTGNARLTTTDEQYIELDELEVGTCLRGEGTLDVDRSWGNQLPVFTVSRLESLGRAKRSVSSVSEGPSVEFSVTRDREDCETAVTLRHDEGDSVPADQLRILTRPVGGGADLRRGWWYEFDGDVEPGDSVGRGDSLTLALSPAADGTLVWADDWSTQLAGWETEPC